MRPVALLLAGGLLCLAACSPPSTEGSTTTTAISIPAPTTREAVAPTTTLLDQSVCIDEQDFLAPPGLTLAFFAVCDANPASLPVPIYRDISGVPSLQQSLAEFVAGANPDEEALGLSTLFDSVSQADRIAVVADVDDVGVAHIDFLLDGVRWDPGPLTSAQLSSMIGQLLPTVFLSSGVMALDLSTPCWGESDCQGVITRFDWEADLFVTLGVLSHRGCDLHSAWWVPDHCTLAGVLTRPSTTASVVNVAADDTINLRAGPGAQYPVLVEVAPGTSVEVTPEAAAAFDGGRWHLLQTASGPGWANGAFLSIPRSDEEKLVDAFVAFAEDPTAERLADLPIGEWVWLGLGSRLYLERAASDLVKPFAWQIEEEMFRAYVGPFSALNALQNLGVYQVAIGEHPHCASAPIPAPDGYEEMFRISVQPADDQIDSCLQWATVDFFVNSEGLVEAITLDVWEP